MKQSYTVKSQTEWNKLTLSRHRQNETTIHCHVTGGMSHTLSSHRRRERNNHALSRHSQDETVIHCHVTDGMKQSYTVKSQTEWTSQSLSRHRRDESHSLSSHRRRERNNHALSRHSQDETVIHCPVTDKMKQPYTVTSQAEWNSHTVKSQTESVSYTHLTLPTTFLV